MIFLPVGLVPACFICARVTEMSAQVVQKQACALPIIGDVPCFGVCGFFL